MILFRSATPHHLWLQFLLCKLVNFGRTNKIVSRFTGSHLNQLRQSAGLPRPLIIVLPGGGKRFEAPVTNVDPRRWVPGQEQTMLKSAGPFFSVSFPV